MENQRIRELILQELEAIINNKSRAPASSLAAEIELAEAGKIFEQMLKNKSYITKRELKAILLAEKSLRETTPPRSTAKFKKAKDRIERHTNKSFERLSSTIKRFDRARARVAIAKLMEMGIMPKQIEAGVRHRKTVFAKHPSFPGKIEFSMDSPFLKYSKIKKRI